jgi:hypothetical protein
MYLLRLNSNPNDAKKARDVNRWLLFANNLFQIHMTSLLSQFLNQKPVPPLIPLDEIAGQFSASDFHVTDEAIIAAESLGVPNNIIQTKISINSRPGGPSITDLTIDVVQDAVITLLLIPREAIIGFDKSSAYRRYDFYILLPLQLP